MNTNTENLSSNYLRSIATDLDRPAAEREAARRELADRIATIKRHIDDANDNIRGAIKANAPEAEQYHRNRRDALLPDIDRALGF